MAWVVFALAFLWPVVLDIEPDSRPSVTALGGRAAVPSSPSAPKFREVKAGDVDREAFLASFARQAGARLMPCLRENLGPRGSIAFTARLSRRGKLSGIGILSPADGTSRLACAREAIDEMMFNGIATSVPNEAVEIEWRFDW